MGTNLTTEAIQLGNTGTTTTLRGPTTIPTLTVTGVTTTGLQTPIPTTFTYTTLPTLTSQQIGYSMKAFLGTNANTAASGVSANPFSTTTFTLTPGVWLLHASYRFRNASGTTSITRILINHQLATPVHGGVYANGFYTNNYGLFISQQPITLTGIYTVVVSSIIYNDVASNVLSAQNVHTYTGSQLQYGGANTGLVVTRIA
jgi:hypothetical protein